MGDQSDYTEKVPYTQCRTDGRWVPTNAMLKTLLDQRL